MMDQVSFSLRLNFLTLHFNHQSYETMLCNFISIDYFFASMQFYLRYEKGISADSHGRKQPCL